MTEVTKEELKAIDDRILVEKVEEEPPSKIIEMVSDKKTYMKAKVISVGENVDYIHNGDVIIVPDIAEYFNIPDPEESTKEMKIYVVKQEQVYCKVK